MYLCYLDESGTFDIPGNTSHYVLCAISVPVWHWRDCDRDIGLAKVKFSLQDAEIHAAWLLRKYSLQYKVKDFDKLSYPQRRHEVTRLRHARLHEIQKQGNSKKFSQTRKNFRKTDPYIHLTFQERFRFVLTVAEIVSEWGFARLFAECIDKLHFDPARTPLSVDEQAFQQVVSRFETYLEVTRQPEGQRNYGLLIHDNNQTVAKHHTELMMSFHRKGTLWTKVNNIIETPLFVDSELTSMVQVADLCSYALRRYLENGEEQLFDHVFQRADRRGDVAVGVRHFTDDNCTCKICTTHRQPLQASVQDG